MCKKADVQKRAKSRLWWSYKIPVVIRYPIGLPAGITLTCDPSGVETLLIIVAINM